MSNIEENLGFILSSRYGKDVRQAIHDAIHDCYEDGKAGATDLIAREQIADTDEKLSAQIANLVANAPSGSEKDSELVDIRVGYGGTRYASAGEAVRKQFSSLSEELEHLTVPSINLFDSSKLVRPGYYRGTGEVSTENATSEYCTNYVSVEDGEIYTWSALESVSTFLICTYNADKEIIDRRIFRYTETSVTFDNTVKFIRFSIINAFFPPEFMFVLGTELPTRYVESGRVIPFNNGLDDNFAKQIKNVDLNSFTKNGTFSFGSAGNVSNSPDSNGGFLMNHYADSNYRWYQLFIPYNVTDVIYIRVKQGENWTNWKTIGDGSSNKIVQKSENLFDYNDLVDGYYRDDGVKYYTDGISKRTEHYIPVDGGNTYTWSKGNLATIGVYQILICTYDSSKRHIKRFITYASGNRYNSITFDENVAYVRLSDVQEEFASDFMFVKGTSLPDVFIPYGEYVKKSYLSQYNSLICDMDILWFGDSISMLRQLPHRVGQNLSCDVYDCSVAGSPFVASTDADYQTLGVKSMIESKINGDMSAQYSAINNLATSQGWTSTDKALRVAQVQTLEKANMKNIECAVILAGTNDHNNNVTLENFKNGIKDTIEAFVTAYPHIELYMISPTWRGDITTNGIGITLEQYVNAEKEIAESHQIPFYDLYHGCGINKQNEGYYLNTDKLHPSENGDKMIAKKCARWLISN